MDNKPLIAIPLTRIFLIGEGIVPGERKHIEFIQYRQTPALVGVAEDMAASSTATVTQYQTPLIPDQYI